MRDQFEPQRAERRGAETWGSCRNLTSLSPTTRWFTDRGSPSAEPSRSGPAARYSTKVKQTNKKKPKQTNNNNRTRFFPERVFLRGAMSPPLQRLTRSSAQINFKERFFKKRHAACVETFWAFLLLALAARSLPCARVAKGCTGRAALSVLVPSGLGCHRRCCSESSCFETSRPRGFVSGRCVVDGRRASGSDNNRC